VPPYAGAHHGIRAPTERPRSPMTARGWSQAGDSACRPARPKPSGIPLLRWGSSASRCWYRPRTRSGCTGIALVVVVGDHVGSVAGPVGLDDLGDDTFVKPVDLPAFGPVGECPVGREAAFGVGLRSGERIGCAFGLGLVDVDLSAGLVVDRRRRRPRSTPTSRRSPASATSTAAAWSSATVTTSPGRC
jgi:hypothetical protein